MARFEKGNPGKPKGAINKLTKTVKEVVFDVFEKIQSDPSANLLTFAKNNPTEFYKIAAKLIPSDVNAKVQDVTEIKVVRE